MDQTDEKILQLMKNNARITMQELGNELGMSRVAAKNRVKKLERIGVIQGYNTIIYLEDETTIIMDVVTKPGYFEDILEFVSTKMDYVRQIFCTTKDNHIHIVAASTDGKDLKAQVEMIEKKCGREIEHLSCHAVTEVIKDVYGGMRDEREERKVPKTEINIQ